MILPIPSLHSNLGLLETHPMLLQTKTRELQKMVSTPCLKRRLQR